MKAINNKGGKGRMSMQVWIIIILLVTSYYQYSSPDKANNTLNPIWGPVKDFIGNNNPLDGGKYATSVCPNVDAPVCGNNGKSYPNSCEAALDDVLQVTPGAC